MRTALFVSSALLLLPALAFAQSDGDRAEPGLQAPPAEPQLELIGDQSVVAGETLTFDVTCWDPIGSAMLLSAAPMPLGASFLENSPGLATFTWGTSINDVGAHSVTFSCENTYGFAAYETVTIRVVPSDGSLTLVRPIGPFEIFEGQRLTFTAICLAPIATPVAVGATGLPQGSSFLDRGAGFADFSWVPDYTQAGSYQVRISCSGGGLADAENVSITVTDQNAPPVLDPIPPLFATVGQTLVHTFTAWDPDGDAISFHALNPPDGTILSPDGRFEFTPDQVGTFLLELVVQDNYSPPAQTYATVEIVVGACAECRPVITPISEQTIKEGEQLKLTVEATSPVGLSVQVSATNLPSGASFDVTTNELIWTPNDTQAGRYDVILGARDEAGIPAQAVILSIVVIDVPGTDEIPDNPDPDPKQDQPGELEQAADAGCGCETAGSSGSAGLWIFLFGAFVVFGRRFRAR